MGVMAAAVMVTTVEAMASGHACAASAVSEHGRHTLNEQNSPVSQATDPGARLHAAPEALGPGLRHAKPSPALFTQQVCPSVHDHGSMLQGGGGSLLNSSPPQPR